MGDVKFIRKNGRIIPIRSRKDGRSPVRKKVDSVITGAGLGGSLGGLFGLYKGALELGKFSGSGNVGGAISSINKSLGKYGLIGAGIGAGLGAVGAIKSTQERTPAQNITTAAMLGFTAASYKVGGGKFAIPSGVTNKVSQVARKFRLRKVKGREGNVIQADFGKK